MAYISPTLTAIANAAKKASIVLTRDFNELEHLQTSLNNDGTFAKRSYEKVEKILKEELLKFKPTHTVISKKTDTIPTNGNYFLITPIDGFINFAHGNGNFSISIALIENNNILDAVIYNPVFDELFFAEKGCGAFKEGFRNHERLRVSVCKNIERSLISCNNDLDIIKKSLELSPNITIKNSVSLDMAYIAAGKTDAVISTNNTAASIAAGILLVKEAGGYVFAIGETDIRSENITRVLFGGQIVATNEHLRQKIANTLAK